MSESILTTGELVVDTSVVVGMLRGEPPLALRFNSAALILLPAPVLGDLRFGALGSANAEAGLARIESFAGDCTFVPCDQPVVEQYSELKHHLKRMGTPIPENDLWIAACVLARGAILITRDSHFDSFPGLRLERW